MSVVKNNNNCLSKRGKNKDRRALVHGRMGPDMNTEKCFFVLPAFGPCEKHKCVSLSASRCSFPFLTVVENCLPHFSKLPLFGCQALKSKNGGDKEIFCLGKEKTRCGKKGGGGGKNNKSKALTNATELRRFIRASAGDGGLRWFP